MNTVLRRQPGGPRWGLPPPPPPPRSPASLRLKTSVPPLKPPHLSPPPPRVSPRPALPSATHLSESFQWLPTGSQVLLQRFKPPQAARTPHSHTRWLCVRHGLDTVNVGLNETTEPVPMKLTSRGWRQRVAGGRGLGEAGHTARRTGREGGNSADVARVASPPGRRVN